MAHFDKLRNLFVSKWVSLDFVNCNFRLSRTNLWANGSCCQSALRDFRLYGTKGWNKSSSDDAPLQIPLVVRREAQAALLDYLHSTRSLLFTDAENISENSPAFLGKLLTKVENTSNNQADIRRAVARFLRYHPINEFEPFFESMGLKPCEYSSLLPRQLIFLNDDPVLMNNYHVLCNYGISRNKIGNFYKEAPEIFRYGERFLLEKLQSFEKMGLRQSIVIKVVASSPRLLVGNAYVDFLDILERLKGVGNVNDWIEKHLLEGNSYNWSLILEVLRLLGEIGCSPEQLGGLVQCRPDLVFEKSGATTLLLIGFLTKFGSTPDEICAIFLQFPEILVGKFLENLQHSYRFLVQIEMDVPDIGDVICSNATLLGSSATKRTNNLLATMNVEKEWLCEVVKENPEVIKNWLIRKKNPKSRKYEPETGSQMMKTKFFLDLGFDENSVELKRAVKCFRGKGANLQERFDTFVRAGLNPKDVVDMLKVAPQILNLSKGVLERKIEFLVKDMGYPVSVLLSFPTFTSYKIQRVKHRLAMYNWLKDQGAADPNLALSTLVSCGDKFFIENYVQRRPEGFEVWEQLRQTIYSHER
ncbi:OLC1v1033827C1 [Oldenlandia corymbosa var. corymbosa]|uniref:OLC1v1033827C1 n=1 Tax=Oldenlandia corymbosa var. corymbosa TaxID=529605 RepID=A0AAV1CSB0_OLDCO|nr:OLC1v1033827C1 [Oldenlandia corymbosa var. corymbosa]